MGLNEPNSKPIFIFSEIRKPIFLLPRTFSPSFHSQVSYRTARPLLFLPWLLKFFLLNFREFRFAVASGGAPIFPWKEALQKLQMPACRIFSSGSIPPAHPDRKSTRLNSSHIPLS